MNAALYKEAGMIKGTLLKVNLLLIITIKTSCASIPPQTAKTNGHSATAINAIIQDFNTKIDSKVAFVINTVNGQNSLDILEQVIQNNKFHRKLISYNIQASIKNINDLRQSTLIVMIIDHGSIKDIYSKISLIQFDYSGYYLIFIVDGETTENYDEVFGRFFNKFIYNLDIMIPSDKTQDSFQLKTFYPFTPESCKSPISTVINEFNKNSWTLPIYFPKKMNNFWKCPLKIAAFIYAPAIMMSGSFATNEYSLYGNDIELIKGFSEALNFTIQYSFDPQPGAWGMITENGDATGGFSKLMKKEVDMMIGMLSKNHLRINHVSFTSTIIFDPVILLIPPGAPLNAFVKLFQPYNEVVWIYFSIVLIVAFLVVFMLSVIPNKIKQCIFGEHINAPGLNVIVAFVGGSQHKLPKNSVARIFLMTFLLFCLIKRTLYTASLFQFLQLDSRTSVVKTIDELVQKDFTVYFYPSFNQSLKNMKFYKR